MDSHGADVANVFVGKKKPVSVQLFTNMDKFF